MEPHRMKSITPTDFSRLDDAVLVDVREPDEVAEVRVDGAVLLPMSTLTDHLDELPEGPVYVLCHAGGRSAKVTQFLVAQGYDATNVEGGITRWQAEGLPVSRG
jgi:rhodanese-related sulfurtransferase